MSHAPCDAVDAAVGGVHHVQITVPRGAEGAARAFYCDVLGMREVPKPQALAGRGGLWLAAGGGGDDGAGPRGPLVHVGAEDGVDRAATKAHVAYEVRGLAAWRGAWNGTASAHSTRCPSPASTASSSATRSATASS